MNALAIAALERRKSVQPTTYRMKMSIITSSAYQRPFSGPQTLVMSHEKT